MNILIDIQSKYNSFSDKEKEIGKWILENNKYINNMNITELSKNIGVSNATITRFCKKIGCESFVDMKIKLSVNKKIESKDELDMFSNIYTYYGEAIKRSNELIDKNIILKVVEKIKKTKRIFIYGVGSSGLTALELMQRLIRMGFNVNSITDSHMMIINSSIIEKDDLVIGISVSGDTKELNNALKVSKKRGAYIVSFTGFELSEINKYSDIVVQVCNTSFIENSRFINSQFSIMYAMDIISMLLLDDINRKNKMQITIDAIISEN